MRATAIREARHGRRAFLLRAIALRASLSVPCALASRAAFAAPGDHPQTLAALVVAHQRETDAHRRYLAYAARAREEGYRGIAYMFTAFATSEAVHARNFGTLIAELGARAEAGPTTIAVAGTKQNLIAAVDDEIDSIDHLYPGTLERLKGEGHAEAIRRVNFALAAERQHRALMNRIRRFSPLLFEQVARTIDEKTRLYVVCDTCGSTLNKVPQPACPVCASPPEQYRKVPVPD